ncbi:MAG: hypothetical protein HYW49_04945 [Deltaproteobacteria bacterium]|nr:hypothetical protein [Deltaproteobacteria bacterium]
MSAFEKIVRRFFQWLAQPALVRAVKAQCAGDSEVLAATDVKSAALRIESRMAALRLPYFMATHLMLAMAALTGFRLPSRGMAFLALRYLVLTGVYSDPRLLSMIGYGPAMAERRNGTCISMAQN